MGDRVTYKSFFSDTIVTGDVYQRELVELAKGRKFMKNFRFDPSLPLENAYNTYSGNAIAAAFGDTRLTRAEMAEAIGVPLDTLKGWVAPKDSKKHRTVHVEQFARIVDAGVSHAHLEDTPETRMKVACRMLGARTQRELERDARVREDAERRTKVKAIALRVAALDGESLSLMLDLSERLFATSTPAGGFDWWCNESVQSLFNTRGERRPDIEEDERESIDRAEYFELVKDALRETDAELIDDLWDAQPDESPLNPWW